MEKSKNCFGRYVVVPFIVLLLAGRCCRPGAAPESKGAHVLGLRADEEGGKLRRPPAVAQVDEPGAQHGAVLQHHVGAGGRATTSSWH